jgi:hypothetical protein
VGQVTEVCGKVWNRQTNSNDGALGVGMTAAWATKDLVKDLDFTGTSQYREFVNSDKPERQIIEVVAAGPNWGKPTESVAVRSEDAETAGVPGPAKSLGIWEDRPVAQRGS